MELILCVGNGKVIVIDVVRDFFKDGDIEKVKEKVLEVGKEIGKVYEI